MKAIRTCFCSLICAIGLVGGLLVLIILLPKGVAENLGLLLGAGAVVAYYLPFTHPSVEYLSAAVVVNIVFWWLLICIAMLVWRRFQARRASGLTR